MNGETGTILLLSLGGACALALIILIVTWDTP